MLSIKIKNIILYIIFILLILIESLSLIIIPKFTYNIINTGIINEGINYKYAIVMSRKNMNEFLSYLDDSEKDIINSSYNLISIKNITKKEYLKYKNKYPLIDNMAVYEYNNKYKKEVEKIFTSTVLKYYQDKYTIKDFILDNYQEVGYSNKSNQNNYILKNIIYLFITSIISIISTIYIANISYHLNKKLKNINNLNIIMTLRILITCLIVITYLLTIVNEKIIITYLLIIALIMLIKIILDNFNKTNKIIKKSLNFLKNKDIFILNYLINIINPLITIIINLIIYLIVINNIINSNYFNDIILILRLSNYMIMLFILIININKSVISIKKIK